MIPKFRVWSKKDNKMYPVNLIRTNYDGSITVNATDNPDYWNPVQVSGKWKEGELLQFTGRKDKKDKEICEGDVLYYCHMTFFSRKTGEVFEDSYARVVWNCGGFTLEVFGANRLRTLDMTTGEIIGNIYENPEFSQEDAQAFA